MTEHGGRSNSANLRVQGVPDAIKLSHLQELLQEALILTGHVEKCALIRRKECSVRVSSPGFQIPPEHIASLLEAFKDPAIVREEGMYFEEKHYKCVRADKSSIYAKNGQRGIILVRTHGHLLVSTYVESMYPSVCVEATEKLAEYLREKGK